MERHEVVGIFHVSGLFSGRVFIHLPSHEKREVIGMPSAKLQKEKSLQIIKQKLLQSHKLSFIAWEPLLMCLAWKILITDGLEVNKKGAFLKIIIYLCFKDLSSSTSANHYFPLRRDYLFTFILCHHLLK